MDKPLRSIVVERAASGEMLVDCIPDDSNLSRKSLDVLKKVRVLRDYTTNTGFKTTKSQNDLIQSLNGDDLASVLLILRN